MNIVMFTNTYIPHVGGVARSVQGFTSEFHHQGHHTLVIAPVFDGMEKNEVDVLRIPALQRFNGSDFSVPVPVPGKIARALEIFSPHIIHSHHPFLLGDAALRAAAAHGVPIVFTHHTRYEQYTHYMAGDSTVLKRFVMELVTGYCNLCNAVVAPSQTIADILCERGVKTLIEVIPTGIDPLYFSAEGGKFVKQKIGIPEGAFVIGHVGRLAPEKNLSFLGKAVCDYLLTDTDAHFLLVGEGPARREMEDLFVERGLRERLHLLGVLSRQKLTEIYGSMDVFVFASLSETQGIVLAEAMASGIPVVALDASGVREIVRDRENGRLLPKENPETFSGAIRWIAELPASQREKLRQGTQRTAADYSMEQSTRKILDLYNRLQGSLPQAHEHIGESRWERARNTIRKQFEIMRIYGQAVDDAIFWKPQQKQLG